MIAFANPEFLWLLLILPLLSFWRGKAGPAATIQYSSTQIIQKIAAEKKSRAGAWLSALRMFALFFAIIALARPQLGRNITEIESSGIDIVLAIDVSGTMQSMDFSLNGKQTSRIDVVKAVVAQFIQDRPNDRIGIIAFAGRPYLVSPLTLDHDWLLQNLERVRVGMVEDRTAIGSAIVSSVNRLRDQKAKSRILILLTDGVNNAGRISPLTAADAARAMNIRIYTVGAGSNREVPLLSVNSFGIQRMMMEKMEYDEDTLKKIADTTSGQYFKATNTESLRNIYREIDKMEKTTKKIKRFESYRELFAYALIPALLILGLELSLSATRWRQLP